MGILRSFRSAAISRGLDVLSWAYMRRLRRHPELSALLQDMNGKTPGGVRSAGVSNADFLALYETVLERQPRYILELGAGRSTAVIALAKPRGPANSSEFIAVEESEMWLNNHREVIPNHLLATLDLIHRPSDAKEVNGVRCAFYRDLPVHPYEFVHVDGPTPRTQNTNVTSDVLDLLPHFGNRCFITFDGREETARFVAPHLARAGFRQRRHPFTYSYQFIRN